MYPSLNEEPFVRRHFRDKQNQLKYDISVTSFLVMQEAQRLEEKFSKYPLLPSIYPLNTEIHSF